MTPLQKVAAVLIGLGEKTAAEVIKHLREEEVEAITQAIASMGPVSSDEVNAALAEFEALFRAGQRADAGGLDFAREAVEKAVGPKKAQQILTRVAAAPHGKIVPKGTPPDRVAALLNKEHPQVIALLLSRMDPDVAGGVLSALPAEVRNDVAYRIATLGDVAPDILSDLEKNLASEIRALVAGGGMEVKGAERAAAILNRAGGSLEKSVLAKLETQDPDLAEQVRRKMFTFEDLAGLSDRDLQSLLRHVERESLALALKLASDRLRERILANLSRRVAVDLQEEVQALGPRRRSEVEEAQRHIVGVARQLEAAGEVSLPHGDEERI